MTTDESLDRLIAARVLALLRESRLTHEVVANGTGISTRSLQRKLIGDRSFSVPELMRLCGILGNRADLMARVFRGL